MKYLAIDYGEKKIGLAGSISGIISNPIKVITDSNYTDLITKLILEIKTINPQIIVIGIPLDAQGDKTSQSEKVLEFGKTLEDLFTRIEFNYVDEFLTSSEAQYRTKENKSWQDDAESAAIILEQFLNQNK